MQVLMSVLPSHSLIAPPLRLPVQLVSSFWCNSLMVGMRVGSATICVRFVDQFLLWMKSASARDGSFGVARSSTSESQYGDKETELHRRLFRTSDKWTSRRKKSFAYRFLFWVMRTGVGE